MDHFALILLLLVVILFSLHLRRRRLRINAVWMWLLHIGYALTSVLPIILIKSGVLERTGGTVILAALVFFSSLVGVMLVDSKQSRM
jgi:hypothetical protein